MSKFVARICANLQVGIFYAWTVARLKVGGTRIDTGVSRTLKHVARAPAKTQQ